MARGGAAVLQTNDGTGREMKVHWTNGYWKIFCYKKFDDIEVFDCYAAAVARLTKLTA